MDFLGDRIASFRYFWRRSPPVSGVRGSAHVYRDSLRIGEQRAEGALLLIPAGGSVEWLEEPDFHRNHQVGIHVLAPGDDARMPDFVSEFLIRWACI
jgi:hypothetical protein